MEDPQLQGAAWVKLALSDSWLGLDPGSVFFAPLLREGVLRAPEGNYNKNTKSVEKGGP
jgi:hypothetical protein